MTRTIYREGIASRRVSDLRPGDRIDLEGDTFADPQHDDPVFPFEFETVLEVVPETPEVTRVDCESGRSFGFPPDHMVEVDAEQPEDHP